MQGTESAYVVFNPDLAIPTAQSTIREFVDVAKAAGLRHLVLLSGRGEKGAEKAEAVVRNSGLEWNVVRANWFMQNFSEGLLAPQGDTIAFPAGDVREPFIDCDDIAVVLEL